LHLTDPIFIVDTTKHTPFNVRLARFIELRGVAGSSFSMLAIGDWQLASTSQVKRIWASSIEGIVIQYVTALPVPYKNVDGSPGSMRSIKKRTTVDLGPGPYSFTFGGVPYQGVCEHPGINEFTMHKKRDKAGEWEGILHFYRPRPDKTTANPATRLKLLEGLLNIEGLLEAVAARVPGATVAYPFDMDRAEDPPYQMGLLRLGALPVVADTGRLADTIRLRSLQRSLYLRMASGTLPPALLDELGGWLPGTVPTPYLLGPPELPEGADGVIDPATWAELEAWGASEPPIAHLVNATADMRIAEANARLHTSTAMEGVDAIF